MIYVPTLNNNNCVVIYDKDTIRVYDTQPQSNVLTNYTDYFINSHYLSKSGSEVFATFNDTCISSNNLTTDFYYRNDLFEILGCFIIIALFCFYLPYKIISRGFGRWLKV